MLIYLIFIFFAICFICFIVYELYNRTQYLCHTSIASNLCSYTRIYHGKITHEFKALNLFSVVQNIYLMCLVLCFYTWTDDCLHLCTFLLRCIVSDNLWFLMLPSKVAATMLVPVPQWMDQCDANWAGRRTATCYLLAVTHRPLDWLVWAEEVKCLVGMLPTLCQCMAVWQKEYLYYLKKMKSGDFMQIYPLEVVWVTLILYV